MAEHAAFLAEHPFPVAFADRPRVERLSSFDVALPVDVVWAALADTSALNRELRQPVMTWRTEGERRIGTTKYSGILHEWEEVPWTFIQGRWLEVTRIYSRGVGAILRAVHKVEPLATGSRLTFYVGGVAHGWLGRRILQVGIADTHRRYAAAVQAVAARIQAAAQVSATNVMAARPMRWSVLGASPTAAGRRRLEDVMADIVRDGANREACQRVSQWILQAEPGAVRRIRVRELAHTWSLPEKEVLAVALTATRQGALTLSWDAVCPHCRGPSQRADRLVSVSASQRCDACQFAFELSGEPVLELTFAVHRSIRDEAPVAYCSAEAGGKPHIVAQVVLAPGHARTLALTLAPGTYRYRLGPGGSLGMRTFVVDAIGATVTFNATAESVPERTGPHVGLVLRNDSGSRRQWIIERLTQDDLALRPEHVFSLPTFRDVFSEEALAPGVEVSVGEQTVLFTDVVGSTSFYTARGDHAAFAEIKQHFDELFAIVSAHRGIVVKTIGDAVMAAFAGPSDALDAAGAMQRAFFADRTDTSIRLRISIHTGPCLAVKLNTDIDYFGSTVNVAAKLQSLADGGQVVVSERTLAAPGVAAHFAALQPDQEPCAYQSAALAGPIRGVRWHVYRAPRT